MSLSCLSKTQSKQSIAVKMQRPRGTLDNRWPLWFWPSHSIILHLYTIFCIYLSILLFIRCALLTAFNVSSKYLRTVYIYIIYVTFWAYMPWPIKDFQNNFNIWTFPQILRSGSETLSYLLYIYLQQFSYMSNLSIMHTLQSMRRKLNWNGVSLLT